MPVYRVIGLDEGHGFRIGKGRENDPFVIPESINSITPAVTIVVLLLILKNLILPIHSQIH